jgi:glycosyltransferase involved in cell wall biosynthesis
MNVLFDISTLGIAYSCSNLRTGIFRVVENISQGLHKAKNCNTTFCASHCNYGDCRNFLDSYPVFHGYTFSQPANLLTSVYNYAEPFRIRMSHLRGKEWKIPMKKIYHSAKIFAEPINIKDIKTADIFHSPFLAVPRQINLEKRMNKFITINDLTPFIYPEYYPSATVEHMRIIFSSIQPDTFVTCISESTKQDFLRHMPWFDPAMVSVVYLAAADHFQYCKNSYLIQQIRQRYGIPSESNYFLALSTLQPHKNFERTVHSFIRLMREEHIKDLHLVIAGSAGWNHQRINKEIENSGKLADRIILTGFVPDEDLAPLYSGAIAFLYPSLYEGFGLPPLEAMQCGTPVITSNNSSLPEVVGDAALMVDPKDTEALCQAMLDIYKNEALRTKLSQASLERAKMFNWEKTTGQYIESYKRALNN